MANVNRPTGLSPIRHIHGAPYNGAFQKYFIPASDATAVFIGDAVKSTGAGDASGIPVVTRAAAGDTIRGVVVGVHPNPNDLTSQYRKASEDRYVYVADAPDLVFEIQDSGTTAAADCGANANLLVGAGSTTSGMSGSQLDGTSKAVTATLQLRILQVVQRADSELGANGKLEVMINLHELKSTTGV